MQIGEPIEHDFLVLPNDLQRPDVIADLPFAHQLEVLLQGIIGRDAEVGRSLESAGGLDERQCIFLRIFGLQIFADLRLQITDIELIVAAVELEQIDVDLPPKVGVSIGIGGGKVLIGHLIVRETAIFKNLSSTVLFVVVIAVHKDVVGEMGCLIMSGSAYII